MKFSYTFLKKLVPEIKSRRDLIEKLNLFVFEAQDGGGDTVEIAVPANRYSSAGHWGLAQELSAVYGGRFQLPASSSQLSAGRKKNFTISVATDACRRIIGLYMENIKIKVAPPWLQKVLETCGLRPINNLVDITNYVMLETGQPLHAFDYDFVTGAQLIVRPAQPPEDIVTLDSQTFKLDASVVVIADEQEPLDIAGIKGGKKAQIKEKTERIILTAANFDGAAIYRSSRRLGLSTDASVRNSHNLTPALAAPAIERAAALIRELCGGQPGALIDVYRKRPPRRVLKFDGAALTRLLGLSFKEREALALLQRLGFIVDRAGRVEVPFWRDDVESFQDLAEEIIRLYGYHNVPAAAPHVPLQSASSAALISFKDSLRRSLVGFGFSEVYNYSFLARPDLEWSAGEFLGVEPQAVTNPVSAQFSHLRPSLAPALLHNIEDNFRFFSEVKIFEVGQIFQPEKTMLGLALASKKRAVILELKGAVDALLERAGVVDRHYPDLNFELSFLNQRESLRIESDHRVLGYLGTVKGSEGRRAVAELDVVKLLEIIKEEKEYEPLTKYPSIMRDLSLLVPKHLRVNGVLEVIEQAAPRYLEDVDLIDFYENEELGENFKSLTFRLVFSADDRTLTDGEVDGELEKIAAALAGQLDIEIR